MDLNLGRSCAIRKQSMQCHRMHYPEMVSIPAFLVLISPLLVNANPPPNVATELSTPDGFPWRIFSLTNAHEFTSSADARGRREGSASECPASEGPGEDTVELSAGERNEE